MEKAFEKLLKLIDSGQVIQIEKTRRFGYGISVWENSKDTSKFKVFQSDTLIDAVMKIK